MSRIALAWTSLSVGAIALAAMVFSLAHFSTARAAPDEEAIVGPWRCKMFRAHERLDVQVAAWLYKYVPSGPTNVVSATAGDSGLNYTVLCAWDAGFAADQWLAREDERRRNEGEVKTRRNRIRAKKQAGDKQLFDQEDVVIDEEEATRKKK